MNLLTHFLVFSSNVTGTILFSGYEFIIHVLAFSSSVIGIISFYEFIIHVLVQFSTAVQLAPAHSLAVNSLAMFWRSTAISFSGYEFIIHVLALNSSTTLILFSCKFIILFPVHVPTSVSGCTVTLQDVQLQCEMDCCNVRCTAAL